MMKRIRYISMDSLQLVVVGSSDPDIDRDTL